MLVVLNQIRHDVFKFTDALHQHEICSALLWLSESGLEVRSIIGVVLGGIENVFCWIVTDTIDSALVFVVVFSLSTSEGLSLKNRSPKLRRKLKECLRYASGSLLSVVIREPESRKYQSLPETPKKKSPADQFIFQRRTSTLTGSSSHDESLSLYAELRLTDSEVESDEDVPGIDAGVQGEGQARLNPGEQDEGQAGLNPSE
nr:hypothetical protein [Tanacetum cinerariifolium]